MSIQARKKHDIIKVKGTAKFCHLNEPNKRFEPEYGAYSCDVIIDEDQAKLLKDQIRPLYEQELQAVKEDNPTKKKISERDLPLEEQEDGTWLAKVKLKAGGRRKDGTEYHLSIALYDAQGKPLPEDVKVWGGSKVNVAFRPKFYYVASIGFGVSLELQAVQVIELNNGGVSNIAAESFGFTSEEGYVANGGETLDQVFDAEETSEEEETVKANF